MPHGQSDGSLRPYSRLSRPNKKKFKLSMEAHRVLSHRGSQIFWKIASQMAVGFPALLNGRSLPPGRFLVLISVRGWVNPRAILCIQGLGQLKSSSDLNGNWTCDLLACSLEPQPTTLPHALYDNLLILDFSCVIFCHVHFTVLQMNVEH
jgi:hypothetical protein